MRYIETEQSIFFLKCNVVWHVSALNKYKRKSHRQIRKMMKENGWSKSPQNEVIHFLHEKNLIL